MTLSILSPPREERMLNDNLYSLSEVSFPDRIEEIGALRIRAWVNEPGIDPIFFSRSVWLDPLDQIAHHWIVTLNDVVIASARMSFHETLDTVPYSSLLPESYWSQYEQKNIASINRLVVDPRYRGHGLARMLDEIRIEVASEKGIDVVLAQPQLNRLKALDKLGFSYVCELPPTAEMPNRPLFFMDLNVTK